MTRAPVDHAEGLGAILAVWVLALLAVFCGFLEAAGWILR